MIGMEILRSFLKSVFATGKVLNAPCTVSALLLSAPGFGKTSIVTGVCPENMVCLFDATGRGITKLLAENKEARHVIFNDLVAVMSHKQSVNTLTLSTINAMTEEGIGAEAYPTETKNINKKCGVIACLTGDMFKDGRRWWNASGLSSRMLPFSFRHSHALQIAINDGIEKDIRTLEVRTKIPDKDLTVIVSPIQAKKIRQLADAKGMDLKELPIYRRHKQYRSLAMGHALTRYGTWKRPSISDADIAFLESLYPYISYERSPDL